MDIARRLTKTARFLLYSTKRAKKKTFTLTLICIWLNGTYRENSVWSRIWLLSEQRFFYTGPRCAVDNVSGNRCESDCRSRGREFDPSPVQYFRGDWLWNNIYGHSPLFRWIIQKGLLSVTSESMCRMLLFFCKFWKSFYYPYLNKFDGAPSQIPTLSKKSNGIWPFDPTPRPRAWS